MVCYFYFLSAFDFVGMLLIGGREFRRPMVPVTFYKLYLYLLKTCPFCKFYGPMTSSYFYLLVELSALLPWLSYGFVLSIGFTAL